MALEKTHTTYHMQHTVLPCCPFLPSLPQLPDVQERRDKWAMIETRKKKLPADVNTVTYSVLAAGEPETGAVHQP